MYEVFDAYHKWLGIPPERQPPDHYTLLGIRPFERDPDVISNAADRQMAHVRSFQGGAHVLRSQEILNAIAAARSCLLEPARKAEYDRTLRSMPPLRDAGFAAASARETALPPPPAPPGGLPPPRAVAPPPPLPRQTGSLPKIVSEPNGKSPLAGTAKGRATPPWMWLVAAAALAAGVVLVVGLGWLLVRGLEGPDSVDRATAQSPRSAAARPGQAPDAGAQSSSADSQQQEPVPFEQFDSSAAGQYQAGWATKLKLERETTNGIGMKLVLVPPGEYLMGSADEQINAALERALALGVPRRGAQRARNESPRHRVALTRAFYLGACEVTQAQYEAVVGSNPSFHAVDTADTDAAPRPVEKVAFADAVGFCNALSRREGLPEYYAADGAIVNRGAAGYRLPTEAEWEFACRAGSSGNWCCDDDELQLAEYAHFGEKDGEPHGVGSRKPNSFGLHDMHGNVSEWCGDWFWFDYYTRSTAIDPLSEVRGKFRVARGGSYRSIAPFIRSAHRQWISPTAPNSLTGFRVARNAPSP